MDGALIRKHKTEIAPFIVAPTSPHTHTFILLHGLGSTGEKFGSELIAAGRTSHGLKLTEIFPGAKFVFPTAKKRRSSAFRRATLHQWFNIASLDEPCYRKETQLDGLQEEAQQVQDILEQEMETIAPSNIVLGGLSQGCAMAISVLLSLKFALGGFIGMNGWLPFQQDVDEVITPDEKDDNDPFEDNKEDEEHQEPILKLLAFERDLLAMDEPSVGEIQKTCVSSPVFLGHGKEDEKIKYAHGEAMFRTLTAVGLKVTWKAYEGQGHWYKVPDEIDDIVDFMHSMVGW